MKYHKFTNLIALTSITEENISLKEMGVSILNWKKQEERNYGPLVFT